MFLICTKDLWCTVSVHVSRSNEGKMAFAGVVTLRPNLNAKCAHSCLWVRYLWSCYFLVFLLPVTVHVRRWTQLRVCERRNLHIRAGLKLRSFDFVIWSNWTQIATSVGFHRPQVMVLTILDSSQSTCCYGTLWKNARMWDHTDILLLSDNALVQEIMWGIV